MVKQNEGGLMFGFGKSNAVKIFKKKSKKGFHDDKGNLYKANWKYACDLAEKGGDIMKEEVSEYASDRLKDKDSFDEHEYAGLVRAVQLAEDLEIITYEGRNAKKLSDKMIDDLKTVKDSRSRAIYDPEDYGLYKTKKKTTKEKKEDKKE